MISNRSYLLKALYEWVLDNDCTPYIVISTEARNVQIPPGYAEDNRIILNISPGAVQELEINQSTIFFMSRFSGQAHAISAPVGAVIAIYAKESGEGMVFDLEESEAPLIEGEAGSLKTAGASDTASDGGASHLRVIK